MALKPEVSSTTHLRTNYGHSPNTGVGLSMMKELTALSLGEMALISGDTWWYQKHLGMREKRIDLTKSKPVSEVTIGQKRRAEVLSHHNFS
jgi:hypothetical protein